jgi:hypothetical protein
MTAQQIYQWWGVWLAVAGVLVLAAAALLVIIVVLARQIGALAAAALALVQEIEANTRPIWQLNTTNKVAAELLAGAQAIEANAGAIVAAAQAADVRRAA